MGWGNEYHFYFRCCVRRFITNWRIRFANA